jgi:hypothetical protein
MPSAGCAYARMCVECGEYTCYHRKKGALKDIQQHTAGFVNGFLAFVVDLSYINVKRR